jgi:hypothetical protein
MVQPKYSPTEALNKMKLMMSYDSSNTLTENEQSLKTINEEAQLLNEVEPISTLALIGWIAGATAAVGGAGAYANASNWFMGSASEEQVIRTVSKLCDSILSPGSLPKQYKFVAQQLNKPSLGPEVHAKIADEINQGANYAFGTDEDQIFSAMDTLVKRGTIGDWCATRTEFDPTTPSKFEELIIDELDGNDQAKVAGKLKQILAKSRKKITTKDDSTQEPNFWIETFPCLRLTNSFPQGWDSDIVADRFGFTSVPIKLKVKGVIKTYRLQSDAKLFNDDGSYTGFKIECAGNKVTPIKESFNREKKNLIEQAEVDFGTGGGGSTPPPPPPPIRNRYKICTGTYTKGCKTEPTGPIGVVQGCLGIVVDGRFWDKTQNALVAKGYANGFTDADISKICEKTKEQEISGELPSEIDPSNTDF